MDTTQQPSEYYSGYPETPYTAGRPPYPAATQGSSQPDPVAPQWTPAAGYDGHLYGFGYEVPAPPFGGEGPWCGGPRFPPPFGFDPSVPPPPLGCPPSLGLSPRMEPPAPINTPHCGPGDSRFHPLGQHFRPGPQSFRYDPESNKSLPLSLRGHDPERGHVSLRAEDDAGLQRTQDQEWVRGFLHSRGKGCRGTQITSRKIPKTPSQQPHSVPELRWTLSRAAKLVSRLTETCESLRACVEDSKWTQSHSGALEVKDELQDLLFVLGDSQNLARWKTLLDRVNERRSRKRRSRRLLQFEEQQREERSAEKEASINQWRLQQIQQVEERKKVCSRDGNHKVPHDTRYMVLHDKDIITILR